MRERGPQKSKDKPKNYLEWLRQAFGLSFSRSFPETYTKKYWTVPASELTTDWVGERVLHPTLEEVVNGYHFQSKSSSHYINEIRYPEQGGFMRFADGMLKGASIEFDCQVQKINLLKREIDFVNGTKHKYERLISTIPLPQFIKLSGAPEKIINAAQNLNCTSLLLVNVAVNHKAKFPFHWMYVYDEDKISTRINCTELLSPNNVPSGKTGIQVEVYESKYKPFLDSHQDIAKKVCKELISMGIIESVESVHTQYIGYANVIFDKQRILNQETVLAWLEGYGLIREKDDTEPMTPWGKIRPVKLGEIILAGRFSQWKYFWTDDCVLRGKYIKLCEDL